MKYSLVILFIIFFNYKSEAQYSGWAWQNPHPVGSHLQCSFFTSANTGYAVGGDGTIIKTTNAGNNWNQIYSVSNRIFYSIYFTNQTTGYVISGDANWSTNSVLLKTTDEGISWDQIYTFLNINLNCLYFINNNTGYIVGSYAMGTGRIFKTTNSGNNWQQYPPDSSLFAINSVFFANDSVGYIAGDNGRILKTSNNGNNWISLISGTTNVQFNSIYFLNSFTGFAAGGDYNYDYLSKTTNGGLNWQVISTGANTDLWDIKFIDMNTGFIAAGGPLFDLSGKILKTTNSGSNWDTMQISNQQNYRNISIAGDNIYAVGNYGTVVRSTNIGSTWSDLSNSINTNYYLNDSYIIDSLHCVSVGDSSIVLRTIDGGSSWSTLNLGGNFRLHSVYFVNQSTGYVAGGYSVTTYPYGFTTYFSKIFKSTDGGINWSLIYGLQNELGELKSIIFTSVSSGFSVGNNSNLSGNIGVIKRTTDGGLSWTSQNIGNDFYSVNFVNSNTGFCCGNNGCIYKTTNSGNSWFTLNSGTNLKLNSITFTTENTGFIGSSNYILKTTNGGLNWNSINIFSSVLGFVINSISYINNTTGFAVCEISSNCNEDGGGIVKTINGGDNWQLLTFNACNPTFHSIYFNSIHFLDNKLGYIVGSKSTILKTTNGGNSVGVESNSTRIPNNYLLSQNYPNPFNPNTKIDYAIPKNGFVTLKIYDILGREVKTLVNENKTTGFYSIDFNGSEFSSGVYFYKLNCNEFIDVKRMILIK